MDKENILMRIQDCGIVAVVRAESADKAESLMPAWRAELRQSS